MENGKQSIIATPAASYGVTLEADDRRIIRSVPAGVTAKREWPETRRLGSTRGQVDKHYRQQSD